MKLLFIHADSFGYETQKPTRFAEDIPEDQKKGSFGECLVVYAAVEEGDGEDLASVIGQAVEATVRTVSDVNAPMVVLYPYAHLSPSLAAPGSALEILKGLEAGLSAEGLDVVRSPFGWYKSFSISCKGHPLSELSREIVPKEAKEEVSEAVKAEERLRSQWFVLTPEGDMSEVTVEEGKPSGFDFSDHDNLRKFFMYEESKARVSKKEPPHIGLMQKLELVDYEPGSDPGNFRYYPKGKLVKTLMEQYVTRMVKDTGGMEIESPIMYDFEHPSLKKYMNRFPARQYTIQTPDKKVFLRFAACFGQFLMMHDATVSYKNLPIRLYELTRYSFRVEQRGELAGLRRLRTFTMPDCHSFCADVDMAKEELKKRFQLSWDILSGIGLDIPGDLEFAIRVTSQFYNENRDFLVDLVKKWGKPALVEMWHERFFYFIFKYEWNYVDNLDKASALNTDQIDVENAERYGITYYGEDGKEHFPYILHQSPSGGIERLIYALLERAHMRAQKGTKPYLPLWLAPTQVRLVPVSDEYIADCEGMADGLGARVDIDDRDEGVGRKIRDAEKEWVNLIVVYGEKEKASGKLPVRMRETGEVKDFSLGELKAHLEKEMEGYPYEPLPLPRMLSKRVVFRG